MLKKILYITFLILSYKFSFAQFSIGLGAELRNTLHNHGYTLRGSTFEQVPALYFIDNEELSKTEYLNQILPNLTFNYSFDKSKISLRISRNFNILNSNRSTTLQSNKVITEKKNLNVSNNPSITYYDADYATITLNLAMPYTQINYSQEISNNLFLTAGLGLIINPIKKRKAIIIKERRSLFITGNNNPTNRPIIGYYESENIYNEVPIRQVDDVIYGNKQNRYKLINFLPSLGFEYKLNKKVNLFFLYQFSISNFYHKDVNGYQNQTNTSLGLNFNVYTLKKKSNKSLDTSQQ
jgi:hypothetical protein